MPPVGKPHQPSPCPRSLRRCVHPKEREAGREPSTVLDSPSPFNPSPHLPTCPSSSSSPAPRPPLLSPPPLRGRPSLRAGARPRRRERSSPLRSARRLTSARPAASGLPDRRRHLRRPLSSPSLLRIFLGVSATRIGRRRRSGLCRRRLPFYGGVPAQP